MILQYQKEGTLTGLERNRMPVSLKLHSYVSKTFKLESSGVCDLLAPVK